MKCFLILSICNYIETFKLNQNMLKQLLAILVLMLLVLPLSAQVKVTGKVTDENNSPLPGASILVKGTTRGVSSDFDGNYAIEAKQGDVLEFSFVGFQTQTKKIGQGEKITLNVVLKEDAQQLGDVVVVGFGVQKKENLTGAVATISAKELSKRPVTNPQTMLQGQVPGLRVVQGTGQPGAENVQIRVRGQGTYSSAGSDPLVLIDGVPGSLSSLNPNDIENISVLKDAASAAIYGSRAANGVVLVTTKSGSDGAFKVEYVNNFALHTPTKMLDIVTNSAEYMRLFNEAKRNSGIASPRNTYTEEMIRAYESATDREKYPNFDWLDYMFNPAFVQTHNLSLNGGVKGTVYNLGLGYVDQPGTMKGFDFEKVNFRLNLKSDIKPWFTIGANVGLERGLREQPRQNQDDAFLSTLAQAPTYAPFLSDGRYVSSAYDFESRNKNMVAIVENNVLKKNKKYDVSSQLWADIKLLKNLNWYTKIAVNYTQQGEKDWRPDVAQYNFHTGERTGLLDVGGQGLQVTETRNFYANFFSYLKYATTLGKNHNVNLQVGYSQEENTYNFLRGYRQYYPSMILQELDAGTAAVQTNKGTSTQWALQSVFGRFNYDYKGRYLLEANVRYDGTSRIAKDNRWGVFPSFSVGWRVTEEEFIKNANIGWLNNLKFRASYGMLGNQNIFFTDGGIDFPYGYQDLLGFEGAYPFDNLTLSPGVAQTALANNSIKWESTSVTDFGVDLTLFKGLSVTYDYYRKHTYDILRRAQVTNVLGKSAPYINDGDMINYGHEVSVQYNGAINGGKLDGFVYGLGFYVDISRNRLTNFGTREIDSYVIRENDLPYNSYYVLEKIGVFQNQKEIENSPKQFSDAVVPGDFKYRDVNGDGVVNNDDRIVVNGRFPDFEYSFNANASWFGFDFSLLFQGVQGRKIYANGWGYDPFRQGAAPTRDFADNRWTKEGSTNEYPRLTFDFSNNSQNRRPSTWYLHDASYLRLKNLTFGYSFPTYVTEKCGISKLRVYFSGDNLFTITNYKGLDPERLQDGRFAQYPQNRIVSMGLNIEL